MKENPLIQLGNVPVQTGTIAACFDYLAAPNEKALCDTMLYDSYLPSQSVIRLQQYLEEDIRFDMDALNEFDISIIEACAQNGGKEQIFKNLIKIIKRL